MNEYTVVLIIITLVNFIIAILNFAKSSGKDTRDLRDSNIKLTESNNNLSSQLEKITSDNDKDHNTFFKKINDHETRITVLEDHDK